MDETLFLKRIGQVILYAIAIGISIRLVALAFRRFLGIDISAREGGALAGAIIAFVAVGALDIGHYVASGIAALLIVGYFAGKLICEKFIRGPVR